MRWKTVPQTSGCNRKRSVAEVDRLVRRKPRDVDEAETSRRLASVSAGRRSSSHWYELTVGAYRKRNTWPSADPTNGCTNLTSRAVTKYIII